MYKSFLKNDLFQLFHIHCNTLYSITYLDRFYHKHSEAGILYKDAALAIDWKIESGKEIISAKDEILPVFNAALPYFSFT